MPNHRTYTDEQLQAAVANSTCWADVMELIGKRRSAKQTDVRAVAARLGLDDSHFSYARSQAPIAPPPLPFSRPEAAHGGRSGLSIAARWFLDRGYNVSVPLEPAPYDIVVESDEGLKKVQVKTTSFVAANGRYRVRLARSIYDPEAPLNARGRYRFSAYTEDEIDLFFIATSGGENYLVPIKSVLGLRSMVLDGKYAACRV